VTGKRSGRAANGRSSVYLGRDGRWHGRVTMGLKSDGTPDRRHVIGLTQAAVTTKVRALEEQRRTGSVADAGRPPTVEEWLRHWLDNIAARKVRASTLDGYRTKVEHRLIPALGKHRLDRLQPEHLEAYYATLAAEGLAPATVLQTHRILSRALKVAVQRGKVHRNVATLVDAPSLDPREIEPLTTEEAHRILRAAAGQRNAARWSVALALGLRQGEALGLAWDAVDLDKGTLAVRQAVQRIARQGLVFTQPKSRAAAASSPCRRSSSTPSAGTGPNRTRNVSRRVLGGLRPRVLPARRPAHRPAPRLAGLERPPRRRRRPRRPPARCPAHRRDPAPDPGRPRPGGDADPRPQPDQPDPSAPTATSSRSWHSTRQRRRSRSLARHN
jgi:hypothetical protein